MKRPRQHEIDTLANRIFRTKLPVDWVDRQQDQYDYGIDYEIEIFDKGQTTGIIFKLQLKGCDKLKIPKKGNIISFSLGIVSLDYYLNQIKIPTVLVICNVNTKDVYWVGLQGNKEIIHDFKNVNKSNKSMTIHIPLSNVFGTNYEQIINYISHTNYFISLKNLSEISPQFFGNLNKEYFNIEDSIKKTESNLAHLYLQKVDSFILNRDFNSAINECHKILLRYTQDYSLSIITFQEIERAIANKYFDGISIEPDKEKMNEERFNESVFIYTNSKKWTPHFKIYAFINFHSNILSIETRDELMMFLNAKMNQNSDNLFWDQIVSSERIKLLNRIHKRYNHILKYIDYGIKNKYFEIIPKLINIALESIFPIAIRIREEINLEIDENNILGHMVTLCELSIYISNKQNVMDEYIRSCTLLGNIKSLVDPISAISIFTDLLNVVGTLEDSEYKFTIQRSINNNIVKISQINDKELNIEEEKILYKSMARAFGINIDNPQNEVDKIIKIGIDDLNPEYVLKYCKYRFISLHGGGLPAKLLKLPTAGSKTLHCIKKNIHAGSFVLENLNNSFSERYCKRCRERKSHPKTWKWSRKWQQQQDKIHKKLMKIGF